jgi:hypothetical protein
MVVAWHNFLQMNLGYLYVNCEICCSTKSCWHVLPSCQGKPFPNQYNSGSNLSLNTYRDANLEINVIIPFLRISYHTHHPLRHRILKSGLFNLQGNNPAQPWAWNQNLLSLSIAYKLTHNQWPSEAFIMCRQDCHLGNMPYDQMTLLLKMT